MPAQGNTCARHARQIFVYQTYKLHLSYCVCFAVFVLKWSSACAEAEGGLVTSSHGDDRIGAEAYGLHSAVSGVSATVANDERVV